MDLFDKLDALKAELDEHMQRLTARAAAIKLSGPSADAGALFAEVMGELVSTSLDFTKEALECIGLVAEELPDADGLAPEEVDTLRRPLLSYLEMLNALIQAQGELPTPQKKQLEEKREECTQALGLLDELAGDLPEAPGEEPGEEEDEGDEGDDKNN